MARQSSKTNLDTMMNEEAAAEATTLELTAEPVARDAPAARDAPYTPPLEEPSRLEAMFQLMADGMGKINKRLDDIEHKPAETMFSAPPVARDAPVAPSVPFVAPDARAAPGATGVGSVGDTMFVLDLSATAVSGARTHEIADRHGVPRPFEFKFAEPKVLPFEIAIQFLKSEGFVQTDVSGNIIEFKKTPKRPEDLEAGEKLVIAENETIARFDELTDRALRVRAAALPSSEEVVRQGPRERLIAFITTHYATQRAKNTQREEAITAGDGVEGGFTPPPALDEEFY